MSGTIAARLASITAASSACMHGKFIISPESAPVLMTWVQATGCFLCSQVAHLSLQVKVAVDEA